MLHAKTLNPKPYAMLHASVSVYVSLKSLCVGVAPVC
jgi:hypothetical protein